MASYYVKLNKQSETGRKVVYTYFTFDEKCHGSVSVNKLTGEVSPIKLAVGDEDRLLYQLAARKLFKHFQAGEFPDITSWVS